MKCVMSSLTSVKYSITTGTEYAEGKGPFQNSRSYNSV